MSDTHEKMKDIDAGLSDPSALSENSAAELSPEEKIKLRKDTKKQKKEADALARAAKKERREYERRRSLPSVHKRPIICPPDKNAAGTLPVVLGYACRIILIIVAVFAVTFFAADAFAFNSDFGVTGGYILLRAIAYSLLLSVICLIRRLWARIAGSAVLIGVVILDLLPDPLSSLIEVVPNTYGAITNHLSDVGYYKEFSSVSGELIPAAVSIFALIAALSYVPFLVRRVRIIIPAVFSAVILWVVFVFNLTRSNWGITLVIAVFSALIVMFVYDKIYVRDPDADAVDTTIDVFGDELAASRESDTRRVEEKRRCREERRKAAEEKRRLRREAKEGTLMVDLDDELAEYFSEKPRNRKKKSDLTREQKREQKVRLREEKKEKRRQKKEKRLAETAEKRHLARILDARCAIGGFAGAGMFALAMLLLFIPAMSVSGRFKTIDVIDKKVDYYRQYVTALLMGDDPTLDILALEGDSSSFSPRSTEAHPRKFRDIPVMRVETNIRTFPVYLRNWVGVDYADGSWNTAQPGSDLLNEYREHFSTDSDPAETMLFNFWHYLNSSLIPDDLEYSRSSKINSAYGFAAAQVNVKRIAIDSRILDMPSFSLRHFAVRGTSSSGSTAWFLRSPGSNTASELSFADFFDGMYSSYRAGEGKASYATVALLSSMKNASSMKNVSDMIVGHNTMRYAALGTRTETPRLSYSDTDSSYIRYYCISYALTEKKYGKTVTSDPVYTEYYGILKKLDGTKHIFCDFTDDVHGKYTVEYTVETDGKIKKALVGSSDSSSELFILPDMPDSVRYYEVFTNLERRQFKDALDLADRYTDFVYNTYTGKSGSRIISDMYEKIVAQAKESISVPTAYVDEETGEVFVINEKREVPADFSIASDHNEYKITTKSGEKVYTLVSAVTDRDVYYKRHKLVMSLIDYLADPEKYSYTLDPTPCDIEGLDGVEKFLTVTHEGYCVQFASSVVLMLREAGIPARYVEGYIAAGFDPVPKFYLEDPDNPYYGSYTTTVLDSNAHAWIEVWYDGIGWVQYEATPAYYSEMYYVPGDNDDPHHIDPVAPIIPDNPDDTDVPDDTDSDDPIDNPGDDPDDILERQRRERRALILRIIKTAVICVLSTGVIIVFIVLAKRRANRAEKSRRELFEKLSSAAGSDESAKPTRSEVRRASRLVSRLLEECGAAPVAGEFRDEYAERLARDYSEALAVPAELRAEDGVPGSIRKSRSSVKNTVFDAGNVSRVLDAIAAEEFGYGASENDLPLIAEFYRRIYEGQYKCKVSRLRRFRLRVVTCEL